MGKVTGIEWTDATFNPWWGCAEVSPGCDNCYARELAKRTRGLAWGPGAPRVLASENVWRQPLAWNEEAEREGRRHRVFCASMADVFDAEAPIGALDRLWGLIRATPMLDWQLLTKRPANIRSRLPVDWSAHGYGNVWLGVSAETQAHLEQRLPAILRIPARCHFVSAEPLLGPLDLWPSWTRRNDLGGALDWLIIGGESGPKSRPFEPDWAHDLLQQCARRKAAGEGPAPFVKQLGTAWAQQRRKRHGRADPKGGDIAEWPLGLRVRTFPPTCAACARALAGPDYDYCPSCEEPEKEPVPLEARP